MARKKIEFEIGSGNVFADLGLEDAEELYTRAALGVQVMKILNDRGYSQKESADVLGLKQPEVSAIMRAKFSRFSQCGIRCKPITDSSRIRSAIPTQADH